MTSQMFLLAQLESFAEPAIIVGAIVILVILLIVLAAFGRYLGLYVQSSMTGAGVHFIDLIMMSFRKVNPTIIVRSKIMAVQSQLTQSFAISTRALEAHYLAGGNVPNVIRSLIAANKAKIDLDWQTAQAIDLAGRDLLDAVRTSVYPKVIDCPDPRKSSGPLDAVAGDGIQLKVRARVTVRTNLQQLVGGATEETIVARVGQGIVQAIGSEESYKNVLENPEKISQTVLNLGLEAQTAYEIVSIDIADIDVGDNIGARLQADKAEADMVVAQAKAEELRAGAAAREVEMTAKIQENKAKVVLAEAEIPKAIAESFSDSKMGILDYIELKNLQADTRMRMAISGSNDQGSSF